MLTSLWLHPLSLAWSAAGQTAASFLDIPIGAEPAAVGSAFTAVADNAYATTWNPAGLSRLDVPQLAATHVAYLESIHYEHVAAAFPWGHEETAGGLGISIQSLGSGDIAVRNENGDLSGGSFTSGSSAYTLAYGQRLSRRWAVGTAGKIIREKIDDASASAYAVDGGMTFDANREWSFAAAFANLGTALKLVSQSDPLPFNARFGTAWRPSTDWRLSSEAVYRKDGPFSGAFGLEWSNSTAYALRVGYNTAHTKDLGFIAGVTGGLAIRFFGQELAYAWVPFGELGNTHYFSLLLRWSTEPPADRSYPELPKERLRRAKAEDDDAPTATNYTDYRNLYDVLSDKDRRALPKSPSHPAADKEGSF